MAVILKYLGVDNVYVMSGGTTGWTDAGFELETAEIQPVAAIAQQRCCGTPRSWA